MNDSIKSLLTPPVRWQLIVCSAWLLLAFVFRSVIWGGWSAMEGANQASANMVEVLLFMGLMLACCGGFLIGIVCALVPKWRDLRTVYSLCLICVLSPALYFLIYPLIPVFRLW